MRRVSEYVGKPIVSADTGEKVGTVADVLVDAHAARIIGVIIGGGILSSEHVLPYSDVQTLGSDAVVARSREHVMSARAWHESANDAARSSTFKNKRVITVTGRELGVVRDLYVNEHTGIIEAYDVAGPGFMKLVTRRNVLPGSAAVTVGPDALIVSEEAAREFENEPRAN
jgi:uncharacterized protein YrrD